MISWKVLNSLPIIKHCKGAIVAARVYADVKGNTCTCGGTYADRIPHPDEPEVILPKCNKCRSNPPLYVIDLDAKSEGGERGSLRIRHTKDAKRLDNPSKVLYALSLIQDEMGQGIFDLRYYSASKSKQAFQFNGYIEKYLEGYDRKYQRGEITIKALESKRGLISRELLPYFGPIELFRIKEHVINEFKSSYVSKLRTRDLALGELKVILNQAKKDGLLSNVPLFDKIPRASKRDQVIPYDLAMQTVGVMPKKIYRDFYTLLLTYPIRPCELRALKWDKVDMRGEEFTIDCHFSGNDMESGRKSIKKEDKMGSIIFPFNDETRRIFKEWKEVTGSDRDNFVFISRFGNALSESTIYDAWTNARNRIGHKFAPYECRHASATALYKRTGGDLLLMKEMGGWTNTATLERYVTSTGDKRKYF